MSPLREPPPVLQVPLNLHQCRALMRYQALLMRSPEAEADHPVIIAALGEVARVVKDFEEGRQ